MTQRKPTKLQQLIQAVVSQTGPIARLRLAKLIYLVDWQHYKETGEPLSDAFYLRERKGPLPATLSKDLRWMEGYEIHTSRGRTDAIHRPGKRPRFQASLEPDAANTVHRILAKYAKYSEQNLLLAVYATEPMKALLREEKVGGLRSHEPVYLKKYARTRSQAPPPARSLEDLSIQYGSLAQQLPTIASEQLSDEDISLILEAYIQSLPLIKAAEEVIAQCTAEGGHDPQT